MALTAEVIYLINRHWPLIFVAIPTVPHPPTKVVISTFTAGFGTFVMFKLKFLGQYLHLKRILAGCLLGPFLDVLFTVGSVDVDVL